MGGKAISIALLARLLAMTTLYGKEYAIKQDRKIRCRGRWHRTKCNPGAFGGPSRSGAKLIKKYYRHSAERIIEARRAANGR